MCSSKTIEKIFNDMPNILGIADDILTLGYDADNRDHNQTLRGVMQTFHQEKLKPNKMKADSCVLGIINYLGKFSLFTAEVCEPLRRLTSIKTKWTWNNTYQKLYK